MRVAVLGCGRWGTFLAWYAHRLGYETTLWGRPGSANLARLRERRANEFLELPSSIKLETNLEAALAGADFALISVHAQGLRELLHSLPAGGPACVLCMKGLEIATGQRLTQVFAEVRGPEAEVAVWVGPGHVQSFLAGIPNCMVVDSPREELSGRVIEAFGSDLIRFYFGGDLVGNEVGAATKNVIGLAAGMLDGLNLTALKGALMARAPREIARLIEAMGGDGRTAYGLAHLGDYEATLFSPYSNNRLYGENWVLGRSTDKVAEGLPTLRAVWKLAGERGLDLPICGCLHAILTQGREPRAELDKLFKRSLKREF